MITTSSSKEFVSSAMKIGDVYIDEAKNILDSRIFSKCLPVPVDPRQLLRDLLVGLEQLLKDIGVLAR